MPNQDISTVVIVGAGMAGLRTAEGLRAEGYGGRIVLLSEETHLAYDRPPLSKGFIRGEVDQSAITFASHAQLAAQDIVFKTGRAVSLRPADHEIVIGDNVLTYDRAVIATGATARCVPGIDAERQPPVLRTIDDAVDLRDRLANSRSVTVIGGGLIGCEIAATSRSLGLDVTLIEAGPTLMLRSLGAHLGGLSETLHRAQDVRVLTGVSAADIVPPAADREAWRVVLSNGEVLVSDVVVAGIGASPVVGWLDGSGLAVEDGVVCDETLTTSDPDVMAAGDVARFRLADGTLARNEQWLSALDQARHVSRNILLPHAQRAPFAASDYFWTDQYGLKIQGVGTHMDAELVFEHSDPAAHTFLVKAMRDGSVVGLYAAGVEREFGRMRRTVVPLAS
jgi:NADPH-dependent 2,4-dienoyl-CoA reductase/sulfur reductase-like enzyme